MSVIFIVLPLAILIGAAGLAAFVWAVKSGQFDDLDTPAHRVLFDDDQAAQDTPDSPSSNLEDPHSEISSLKSQI